MLKDRAFLATLSLLLVLTNAPYVYATVTAPPRTEFLGSFYNALDTPVYLSVMRAGARGDWLRTLPYTTELHPPALYYPLYLLVGHLLPAGVLTFHLARVAATLAMAMGAWMLIREILPERGERRFAFLLALLSLGMGWPAIVLGLTRFLQPTDFFVYESTLFLSAFVNPHFPLAAAFEFMTLAFYLRARRTSYQRGSLLAGTVTCLATGLTQPYNVVTLFAVFAVDVIGETIRKRRLWTKALHAALFIGAGGFPIAFYYFVWFDFAPFWADLVAHWPRVTLVTPLDYAVGYAPLWLTALAGVSVLSRQPTRTMGDLLLIEWLVANGLLILSPLGFSERTTLGFNLVLAILTAIAVFRIPERWYWTRRWLDSTGKLTTSASARLLQLAFALILPSILLQVVSTPLIIERIGDLPFYFKADDSAAMRWLATHTSASDIVLASSAISGFIPGFTDARVYSGHVYETYQYSRKTDEVKRFFAGETSDDTRRAFLAANKIMYLYVQPGARGLGSFDGRDVAYLTLVFAQGPVMIYRVQTIP
jgi:hypothetical protein